MDIDITSLQIEDPRQLSQALVQIIAGLDMLNAELARILRLQCADIGCLTSAQMVLSPDTREWKRAQRFVEFYELLRDIKSNDRVAMCHWMRADNQGLGASPHRLIVDDDQLEKVITYLRNLD